MLYDYLEAELRTKKHFVSNFYKKKIQHDSDKMTGNNHEVHIGVMKSLIKKLIYAECCKRTRRRKLKRTNSVIIPENYNLCFRIYE